MALFPEASKKKNAFGKLFLECMKADLQDHYSVLETPSCAFSALRACLPEDNTCRLSHYCPKTVNSRQ